MELIKIDLVIRFYLSLEVLKQARQTQTASRAANETKTAERAAKFEKNPNRATF
jgi:hypothetical protein